MRARVRFAITRGGLLTAALAVVCFTSARAEAANSFGYRKSITIDHTKVGQSTTTNQYLDNFPVLVNIASDGNLRTTGNGGRLRSTNAYDVIFRGLDATTCTGATYTSTVGGQTSCTLSHELEYYDATTGQLVAWVKVPRLRTAKAGNADTVIYMYYGNADLTTTKEDTANVWDSGFKRVYHMRAVLPSSAPSGTTVRDSTSTSNGTVSSGSTAWTASGRAGYGKTMTSATVINMTTTSLPTGSGAVTVSLWMNPTGTSYQTFWTLGTNSGNDCTRTRQQINLNIQSTSSSNVIEAKTDNDCDALNPANAARSTWQYFAWSIPAASTATSFVYNATQTNLTLGNALNLVYGTASVTGTGTVDEVRISNVARSNDWMVTEYNSGNHATSAFYTLGAEVASPTTDARFEDWGATALPNGQTQVWWRTGLEVETLGFHVWRESAGRRTRITPALIAGSLLTRGEAERGAPLRAYAFVDSEPLSGAPVQYSIEEVDARGPVTVHGPFAPTPGAARAIPPAPYLHDSGRKGPSPRALEGPLDGLATRLGERTARAVLSDASPEPWVGLSRRGVKLTVTADGWHQVDGASLRRAGLDGVDPRRLALFVDGRVQAFAVQGEEDGQLDDDDFVAFYGSGRDEPYEGRSLYWLVDDPAHAERVRPAPPVSACGRATNASSGFPFQVTRRDRTQYFGALNNGDDENFFGPVISDKAVEMTLDVHHRAVASGGDETVSVALQGVTLAPHRVQALLNGVPFGTLTFDGREPAVLTAPTSSLRDGTNVVRLERLPSEGSVPDVTMVAAAQITYRHSFVADDDRLTVTAAAGQPLVVAGFHSPVVRAFDVTAPDRPKELGVTIRAGGDGYEARVLPLGHGSRRVVLASALGTQRPSDIVPVTPRALDPTQTADMVIIAPVALVGATAPLAAQRESQGLRVSTVDLETVFDAFSFGAKSPQAIRDYVRWARERWPRAPRYVLLVGDGSFDPRNHLGTTVRDLLPVRMVGTALLETASDDWYVDLDDDERPDLAIGRLPARNESELRIMVAKILAWPGVRAGGSQDLLLVTGTDPEGEVDFGDLALQVAAAVSPRWRTARLSPADLDATAARAQLADALATRPSVVGYLGHGSVELWSGPSLLTSRDVPTLPTTTQWPVYALQTCLNNYFFDVYTESVGEALLRSAHTGAVAAFGSTGLTQAQQQTPLTRAFAAALFDGKDIDTLGDAVRAAKRAADDRDVRRTWLLLGDPSLPLDPTKPFATSARLDPPSAASCAVAPNRSAAELPPGVLLFATLFGARAWRRRQPRRSPS